MPTKLLIVDDSALMRRQLTSVFSALPGYVCQPARNGKEAVALNHSFQPDVVLLDINMPEMDGLSALALMMTERPVPVVMLSSLTEKGALVTFEALALGAVDYIAKPGGTISLSLSQIEAELVQKVSAAKQANLRRDIGAQSQALADGLRQSSSTPPPAHTRAGIDRANRPWQASATHRPPPQRSSTSQGAMTSQVEVVIVGVSTGGPKTLEAILPQLPADFPCPVVVAQHMPEKFTFSFAQRMHSMCALQVSELSRLTPLKAGHAYICRGGADVELVKRDRQLIGVVKPEHAEFLWHPSVEVLARSAQKACTPANVIGVMLTGMGNDGATAFRQLHQQGAKTIAESAQTAVVNGMPGELVKLGGASTVLPAHAIAQQLIDWVSA